MQKLKNIKHRFFSNVSALNLEELTKTNFIEALESSPTIEVKKGDIVKGIVIRIQPDVVVVDIGGKTEGRIPSQEFKSSVESKFPEIGDEVEVYVERLEGKESKTILSRQKVIREQVWSMLEKAHSENEQVEGTIFAKIKGGFTVDLGGVVAFLPGSHVDLRPIKDSDSIMNISQPFYILNMDSKLGNVIVSRRAVLEESRKEVQKEAVSTIKEGMVLEGIVKNITPYGAFVDLKINGVSHLIDGLLHLTDISWGRINHPSEVLEIGQEVKVMVIQFDPENNRISLGLKQLNDDPWQEIQKEFPIGNQFTGKVSNITDYGAFIELKNGIEGLVHSSEISWNRGQQNPSKTLSIGQEVNFTIVEIDSQKHRISLSIKRCQENPFTKFVQDHKVGDLLEAQIKKVADFGIFVEIAENLEGLIHSSDISWEEDASKLLKSYKEGQMVKCKIIILDKDKERVGLGVKQLKSDPVGGISKMNVGAIITGIVQETTKDQVILDLGNNIEGIISEEELAIDKADRRVSVFSAGDHIDAKILSVDKQNFSVTLSIKAMQNDERKDAIKKYGSAESGAAIGEMLGEEIVSKGASEAKKEDTKAKK